MQKTDKCGSDVYRETKCQKELRKKAKGLNRTSPIHIWGSNC